MFSGQAGLLLLLLAACAPDVRTGGDDARTGGARTGGDVRGKVVSVQDGDSITILHRNREIRVRLWGVDCPERHQPFSRRARQYTSSAVHGQTVSVEVLETDRYDRLVGTVYTTDGRELNAELLRDGFAWWYRRYAPDRHDYEELERQAREARRGLWKQPSPVPPWEWRQRSREDG